MAETCSTCRLPYEQDAATGTWRCPSCLTAPQEGFREPETWELGKTEVPPGSPEPLSREFGQYEVMGEITRGGMGVIYRVRQKHLKRVVAMKVLIAGRDASGEQIKRFLREARAAARLRHPNIVSIHDVGSTAGKVYFTMDLIEGESLHERLRKGRLPYRESVALLKQVAGAVQYAHENGVIHRDIKPGNILIDKEGRALLTDFGLARTLDSETLHTRSGTTMGTPHYMSPEQAQGDVNLVDARSDVYSLGAVFYEMLTGVPPFVSEREVDILLKVIHEEPVPPARRDPKVPRDLQTICLAAIEKNRERRYASAKDMAADLEAYLAGEPIRAQPASLVYTVTKKVRKHRAAAAAAVLGLVASGGILVYKEFQDGVRKRDEQVRLAREQARVAAERQERERRQAFEEATTAYTEGRFDDAATLLDAFCKTYPDAPEVPKALFHKGVALMNRGDERMDAIDKKTSDGEKKEIAALFTSARGAFDEIDRRFPKSEEAREAPLWRVKTYLWEGAYEAFDASYTELSESNGATSRATIRNDVLRGASRRVLAGFEQWFMKRIKDRPSLSPEDLLKEIDRFMLMKQDKLAVDRAKLLLNLGFDNGQHQETLAWTETFLFRKDYEPLRRADPFFPMWAEVRRARAFSRLEQDQPVVDLLETWDGRFPSPELAFRERFAEGDPRDRFVKTNPRPIPKGPNDFPPGTEPGFIDRSNKRALQLWQNSLQTWERANPDVAVYDEGIFQINTYNELYVEAGGILIPALKRLGRPKEADACCERLASLVRGWDVWHKARVDLFLLTTQVEMGNTVEAQRMTRQLEQNLNGILLRRAQTGENIRLMAETFDEIGNFGFLKGLQTPEPDDIPAYREAAESYMRAADFARRVLDEDLCASINVKLGLVRYLLKEPGGGEAAFQEVIHRQDHLKEPFYAHVAHLMTRGKEKESPQEFLTATGVLSEPSLKNDVPFWLAMRSLMDQNPRDAATQLHQARDQSKGREWPHALVEPLLRRLQ